MHHAAHLGQYGFTLLHSHGDEHVVYSWRNIDVCLWKRPASASGVRALSDAVAVRVEQAGAMSSVHVVLPTSGFPDRAARTELTRLAQRSGRWIRCAICVLEREGFWASALRGLIDSLYFVASRSVLPSLQTGPAVSMPPKVVASLAEVVAWLPDAHAHATGVRVDCDELRAILSAIRRTCS